MTTASANELDPHPVLHWWRNRVVATVDHSRVVEKVEEEGGFDGRYVFMTLMSAGIAVLGLLLSSPAVVIGAMLISPLMGPIIGLGFAITLFNSREIRRTATALGLGTLVAIFFTAAIVLVSPLQSLTTELAARTRPNLFDLLVALFSGLAGAYAMIRGREGAVVGVAIATALMPPLATVGFGLATLNSTVFLGALLLFFTNFMVIAASAAFMARLYGFGPSLSPKQSMFQTLAMLVIFAVLAVPLGFSLRQIAWEATAQRQAREAVATQFGENSRISQLDIDYGAEPLQIAATVLTPNFIAAAEQNVGNTLEQAFKRPVNLQIEQFRVGIGEAEATQVSRAQDRDRSSRENRAVEQLAQQLALVAGVPIQSVLVDREKRRATVTSELLPGANLSAYHELELRIGASVEEWSVELVPPALAPAPISFGEEGPDAAGQRSLRTAIWAAKRLRLPVGVTGAAANADAVVLSLTEEGVTARRLPGGGPVTLEWLAPQLDPDL